MKSGFTVLKELMEENLGIMLNNYLCLLRSGFNLTILDFFKNLFSRIQIN